MKKSAKFILWPALALAGLISLYLIFVFSFWIASKNRFYPNTVVAGVSVGGKTKAEAKDLLNVEIEKYQKEKINFSGTDVSELSDISGYEVVYNVDGTLDSALAHERNNPFLLGSKQTFPLVPAYNISKISEQLNSLSEKIESQPTQSKIELKNAAPVFVAGKKGTQINFGVSEKNFVDAVSGLSTKSEIAEIIVEPSFSEKDFEEQKGNLQKLANQELVVVNGTEKYPVSKEEIFSWLSLGKPRQVLAYAMGDDSLFEPFWGGETTNNFSHLAISNYLKNLSTKINTNPENANLSVAGGQVVVATMEKNGKSLNILASADAVIGALEEDVELVDLVVETSKATVRSDNLAELGLSGLLSTGYSNFAGSPANRRHNIKTGASKFNGVLIKPDEEFSFNTTLGPVDASTGYLPELVILENKTTPQFGGGMCQVSSTAFRAALNAGLPILERTAHAYPVTYYKPYGVDATIYLPKPDLIFKNDTGKYILVQTRIEGYNLYFDFYGTKPARDIKFAGSEAGTGAVFPVEKVTPLLTDQGARGNGSFTATFWRFIYDASGKLLKSTKFTSKYDSPDKYPH